jgi:hypothetical protein
MAERHIVGRDGSITVHSDSYASSELRTADADRGSVEVAPEGCAAGRRLSAVRMFTGGAVRLDSALRISEADEGRDAHVCRFVQNLKTPRVGPRSDRSVGNNGHRHREAISAQVKRTVVAGGVVRGSRLAPLRMHVFEAPPAFGSGGRLRVTPSKSATGVTQTLALPTGAGPRSDVFRPPPLVISGLLTTE